MLTMIFVSAAVVSACTAARWYLCRAGRRETEHWGGRVRLTALWNSGGAFGLPIGRRPLLALSLAALAAVDLEALRAYNPEVAGWIEIPDTGISYPLMQGANNQWYLKHTWTGEPSSVGAIFMDSRNSRDLGDFHTVVYGHRLRSGAMFAPLRFYEDDAYRQEHPSVYIADDAGLHRYDIFAVYAADVKDRVYQELDVEDEETRQAFIRFCLDSALADTGVTPEAGDRILTLSTCTGDGYAQRWVVQAVLRPEEAEGGGGG